jgi:hypothetical protein
MRAAAAGVGDDGVQFIQIKTVNLPARQLTRQFQYVWTVNWRCVSEEVFLDRRFHALLLALHVAVLLYLAVARWWPLGARGPLDARALLTALFTANFVGVCFARSLHYQFYSWYFYSLPLLLHAARVPWALALGVLVAVEVAFNVFPATAASSALLQGAHGCQCDGSQVVLLLLVLDGSAAVWISRNMLASDRLSPMLVPTSAPLP